MLRELSEEGYREHIRGHALNDDFAFSPASYRAHPERAEALADALWEHAGTEAEFLKHVLARQGYDTLADLAAVPQPCCAGRRRGHGPPRQQHALRWPTTSPRASPAPPSKSYPACATWSSGRRPSAGCARAPSWRRTAGQ